MYKVEVGSNFNVSYDFIGLGVDDIDVLAADMSFGIHIEYYHDSVIDEHELICEFVTYH